MFKKILLSIFLVQSFILFAQENTENQNHSEPSNEPQMVVEGSVPEGEYEVVSPENEVLINGVPFIQYSLAPKAKPTALEEKNSCDLSQFDQSKIFDRTILATNIAATALAAYGVKTFKYDKTKHFLAGYVIGNVATGGFQLILPKDMQHRKLVSAALGFGTSVLIGTGKELKDHYFKSGNPEVNDALVTFAGGAAGVMTFPLEM